MIVNILLTIPINRLFSYRIKESELKQEIVIGNLVKVDFKNKKSFGIIFGFEKQSKKKLKFVEKIFFDVVLKREFLEALEIFAYYSCNSLSSILKLSISGFNETIHNKLKKSSIDPKIYFRKLLPKTTNTEQQRAISMIKERRLESYETILLDGVTGSGKTRVYMNIIQETLKKNLQCLVLVPEIILTSQWIFEFENEYGFKPEIYHSSITKSKRNKIWLDIVMHRKNLVVGTRSALFIPFKNLGLIVLDEEHDSSYKQEEGVILNSRDWAVLLAKKNNCKIILSTATPSIETQYNCDIKKYSKISLTKRVNNAVLPEIKIIDMRKSNLKKNSWISDELQNEMKSSLKNCKQILLFLNKRGYAPVVICKKCGYTLTCPHCDFALVLHKNQVSDSSSLLICHYCSYSRRYESICPSCKSKDSITLAGPGIEKIYEEVKCLFPKEDILLLSSDTIKNKNELSNTINSIKEKKVKIIIGTQIISKGHHFPDIETVGIINIDNLLNSMDFRSSEKAYQLITQVAGRSGREKTSGKVIVQTFYPESNLIKICCSYQKENFYKWELNKRKKNSLPPYTNLISIIIENTNRNLASNHAYKTATYLKKISGLVIFGPTPAPLFKLRKKFRYRLLIRFSKNSLQKKKLKESLMKLNLSKFSKIKIDVDPYNFL